MLKTKDQIVVARLEACPIRANDPEAEPEVGTCEECRWEDRVLTERGDKLLCKRCVERCENCGIDTHLVNGRLCEWCDEQAVAAVQR